MGIHTFNQSCSVSGLSQIFLLFREIILSLFKLLILLTLKIKHFTSGSDFIQEKQRITFGDMQICQNHKQVPQMRKSNIRL